MTFDEALPAILKFEGGYVNDKDDPGGATNKGITQAVFDVWRKSKEQDYKAVRWIQDKEVAAIYHQNYWKDGGCNGMPQAAALVHFDFCVNAGTWQAAKTLQKVLGVKADGKVGPITLTAAKEYGDENLVRAYSNARREFYTKLATRRPVLAKFLSGWLKRTNECEKRALKAV